MNTLQKLGSATVLAATLGVAGCGSSDSGTASSPAPAPAPVAATLPPPGPPVPAGAGASVSAFIAFLQGLSGTDETSQPSAIPDSFAVPDNEASSPSSLS